MDRLEGEGTEAIDVDFRRTPAGMELMLNPLDDSSGIVCRVEDPSGEKEFRANSVGKTDGVDDPRQRASGNDVNVIAELPNIAFDEFTSCVAIKI